MGQEAVYAQFKELIRITCGFALEGGREDTLVQSIQKRMKKRNVEFIEGYHALLIREVSEIHALIELLTVNETYFFREPEHLKLVVDTLIPELLAFRKSGTIRILSVGCSTGEEPYSIAMLLRERFGAESEKLFHITAVDIDTNVIDKARKGIYHKPSFRGMDSQLLERYFIEETEGQYRVCENIRKQVKFEVMNLLCGNYSIGMSLPDFIFYRNISIYFPQDVQRRVFNRLADLLNEWGYLIVGAAETLHHDLGIIPMVSRNSLFFFRKQPFYPLYEEHNQQKNNPVNNHINNVIDSTKTIKKLDAIPPNKKNTITVLTPAITPKTPINFDPNLQYEIALHKAQNNKYDEALELVESIIEINNTFTKAHGLKASLQLTLARFDEAITSAERLLELAPLCTEAFLMLGLIARHKGNDELAFKRFREAIYLNASCWMSHFYTAEILYSRKEQKKAQGNYEAVIRILASSVVTGRTEVFFPLSFNAEQFIRICHHKLTILKETP